MGQKKYFFENWKISSFLHYWVTLDCLIHSDDKIEPFPYLTDPTKILEELKNDKKIEFFFEKKEDFFYEKSQKYDIKILLDIDTGDI